MITSRDLLRLGCLAFVAGILVTGCKGGGGGGGNGPGDSPITPGGGGGGDPTPPPPPPPPPQPPPPSSAYLVLNLLDPLSGLEQKDSSYDPKTALDNQLVFSSFPSGSVTTGSPDTELGHDADEVQAPGLVQKFYLSTFELTQIQWRYLTDAFNEPWKSVQPRTVVGTETSVFADRMPAFGVSWQALNSAVDARNLVFLTNGATQRIGIPTSAEWQYAARHKSVDKAAPYSWGTDESTVVVSEFAVVRETTGTVRGPRLVGGRKPNKAGLFDMHGNVWEWTKTADSANLTYVLQGGSWNDNLLSARTANVQHQLPDVGYATAGVRLTLLP